MRRRVSRRAAGTIALIGWTVVVAMAWIGSSHAGPSTQSAPAAAGPRQPCGCPGIPAVATSAKPDPGKVPFEWTFDDLEWAFSNRAVRTSGNWDEAMRAFAETIDPDGSLKVWDGTPVGSQPDIVPLKEGDLTGYLIDGYPDASTMPMGFAPAGQDPQQYALKFYYGPSGIDSLTLNLVTSIARANKYGETHFGFRDAALRAARFLIDDLSRIPPAAMAGGGKAARLVQVRRRAFAELVALIADAGKPSPRLEQGLILEGPVETRLRSARERRSAPETQKAIEQASSGALSLDRFDLANAALDIFMSVDDKGGTTGLFRYFTTPPPPDSKNYVIGDPGGPSYAPVYEQPLDTLVSLASFGSRFGGAAAPGSSLDLLACKAFAILVKLSDYRRGPVNELRGSLLVRFQLALRDPTLATDVPALPDFRVLLAATILSGFVNEAEGRAAGRMMVDEAQYRGFLTTAIPLAFAPSRGGPKVFDTIRDVAALGAGPGREAFAQQVDDYFDSVRNLIASLSGRDQLAAQNIQGFIDGWNASAPDIAAPDMRSLCPADRAPPDVLIYARTAKDPVILDKLYQDIPLMIATVFPEPYDGTSYPVAIRTSGGELDLVARPVDDRHIVFMTDPFVIPGHR